MTASASTDTAHVSDHTGAPEMFVRDHRWRVFGAAWVVLSLLSILWSLATPLAASPDEPAHIVKAASVARGQFIGENSSFGQVVQVPRYIASTHADTCFAFHPNRSADCVEPSMEDPAEIVDAATSAGLYNPVYYLAVGWPSLLVDDSSAIYLMRALSAVLSSLFLAFTVMIAYGLRRNRIPLAAMAIAVPPMLLFLGGSVNPNAVEITATLAVFSAMLAIVVQPSPRLLTERAIIVTVSAAIAVNTRGLSPLWVALAIFTPLILLTGSQVWALLKKPAVVWATGIVAGATAFAAGWLLSTNSLTASQSDPDYFQSFPGVGASPLTGFVVTIRDTFEYAQTMIGNFGWLDTPAPFSVYFIWSALVGTLLLAGFTLLRGRAAVLGSVLVASFIVLPAIVQGAFITSGGIIWQGRYALPLFVMLVFGLAVLIAERIELRPEIMNRLTVLVWGAWGFAQFVSFATALKRYAVGADGSWKALILAPEWSAPGGNLLWLALFAVVLCGVPLLLRFTTAFRPGLIRVRSRSITHP